MHAFLVKLVVFFFAVRSCIFFLRETLVKKIVMSCNFFCGKRMSEKIVQSCNFFFAANTCKKKLSRCVIFFAVMRVRVYTTYREKNYMT